MPQISLIDLKRLLFRLITLGVSATHYRKLRISPNSSLGFRGWKENSLGKSINTLSATPETEYKQLLVDISELIVHDAKSGIQRVVRSILRQLIQTPPTVYKVEPVYWDGLCYRYASQFMTAQLPHLIRPAEFEKAPDSPVEVAYGDIFLGLDLSPRLILGMQKTLERFRHLGVEIYFAIYDILLVDHPEWFSSWGSQRFFFWLETVSKVSTGLLCISQATADAVQNWLTSYPPKRRELPRISVFHLGADIDQSLPTLGLPENAADVLSAIKQRQTVLMVGTVEPRKGHTQVVSAFDQLWASGVDINLVIVGRAGWQVGALIHSIRSHPQREKKLFWLSGISDEYLEKVYAASTVLLVASEGEGFGLPLIEAAKRELPIIARELDVFKEVTGGNVFYFKGKQPEQLAEAITVWLALYAEGKAPLSRDISWLTWRESTQQLLQAILPRQ